MPRITEVAVGDRFESYALGVTVEIARIWFEFDGDRQRWETLVDYITTEWGGNSTGSASVKASDFIMTLIEGKFVGEGDPVNPIDLTALSEAQLRNPVFMSKYHAKTRVRASRP
jgi:hypothetical protein